MSWGRFDDRFTHHPKILKVGVRAAYLYVAAIIYCTGYRTDGFVPKEALPILAPLRDFKRLARKLVEVRVPMSEHGLWVEVDGGYQIHDYLEYQPSAAEARAREEADKQRLRAARARAGVRDERNGEAEGADAAAVDEVVTTSSRRRPVPTPSPTPTPSPSRSPRRSSQAPHGVCLPEARETAPAHAEHTHDSGGREERSDTEVDHASVEDPARARHDGDPDVAAILAHVAAMPAPIAHLATPELAARFAGARANGLSVVEICTAISAAGLKLGKHASAGPSDPRSLRALADHVGSFIANQRRVATSSQAAPSTADPDPAEKLLRRWCESYAKAEGATYTATDEDQRCAVELVELSRRVAGEQQEPTEPGRDERIAEHWIARYLEDEGVNGYLAKARHPLRFLKRNVGTYGVPKSPKPRSAAVPVPETSVPRLSNEDHAARAADALRALGGRGPAVRKCEAPAQKEEADTCSA